MLHSLIESARAAEKSGKWDEALTGFEDALARVPGEGQPELAADLLRWIGTVRRDQGEVEVAGEVYETSLAIAEANGSRERTASALNALASVEQLRGRLERAAPLYARAGAIAEELGDDRRAAMIDQNLGTLATIRGDVEAARLHYAAALDLFRRLDDDQGAAWVLHNLGMVHVDAGEWGLAEACFDEAFRIADRLQDARTLGNLEVNRAELYLKRRDFTRAREHCDRAFEIFSRLDGKPGTAESHKFYGVLYRETSKPHLSEMHLSLALELARICQDPLLEAEVESELAHLYLSTSQYREALRCLSTAHRIFVELGARREMHGTEQRLARLQEVYLETAWRWAAAQEANDPQAASHHARVEKLAASLAEAMGVEGAELAWLRVGALVHDIGKREVPGKVLGRTSERTEEEWRAVRSHVAAGERIVAELDFPRAVQAVVRGHQERWDGGGFPDGLAATEIPLGARILRVVDVFDDLTSERSHRPAVPAEEALRVMAGEAGRMLDPVIFARFRSLVEEWEGSRTGPGR